MSHVKKTITLQSVTREKILQVLAITDMQYGDLLMAKAFAYLQDQLGGGTLGKELSESSLFWAWWRNHWHDIDADFLTECERMDLNELREYYNIVHHPMGFEYTPHRAIMLDALKDKHKPIIKHQL